MLHLTKVAYGAASFEEVVGWFERRASPWRHSTRYLPKRHADIVPGGSLYWILKHQLVARCEILGFEPGEGNRTDILLSNRLIRVQPQPKRAHQGWRYLEGKDAPVDLGDGAGGAEELPLALLGELSAMGLI